MIDVVCIASWNADLVSRVPRPIARGETLLARSFEISPGGKGSNAAIAAARQGASVAVIARVGNDDFGRMALDLWHAEHIDTQYVEQVDNERSGAAQIHVYDDGDNSISVFPGAGAGLAARHAQAAHAALASCRVVMAPCEVPLEATLEAFRIAHARGALTVLNPAPACPLPDALLNLVDVLTPNENEVRVVAGMAADASIDAAAQSLLARGAKAVVVTLGAAGCALYLAGLEAQGLPGRRMTVVDTIGAGDTFTGALAAALARGAPVSEAMRWANAAAAMSVTGRGAIAGMPSRAQVEVQMAAAAPP
jgi:ribokinase